MARNICKDGYVITLNNRNRNYHIKDDEIRDKLFKVVWACGNNLVWKMEGYK